MTALVKLENGSLTEKEEAPEAIKLAQDVMQLELEYAKAQNAVTEAEEQRKNWGKESAARQIAKGVTWRKLETARYKLNDYLRANS